MTGFTFERRRGGRAAAALLLLGLAGCGGGSGEGLDAAGRPVDGSSTGNGNPPSATFASIQQTVFTPICTACHVGATAPMGLRLDADNSYALLVGVASAEVPSLQRVAAGRPDDSYIVQKLEGHAAVGVRMPYGGPYLDATTIGLIRQWIADGALREVQP